MASNTADSKFLLRKRVYTLLIFAGLGMVTGRIMSVDSIDKRGLIDMVLKEQVAAKRKELAATGLKGDDLTKALDDWKGAAAIEAGLRRPFLSGNDRSRWCTVRALVEPDMRVEGAPYAIDKVIDEPGWDTIDMVKTPDSEKDGVKIPGHLYSSKPPLLSTVMAGEYWLIYHATGMSLGTNPYIVGRIMLLTINGVCLLLYFLALSRLIERLGTTDWGRLLGMTAGVFGTFLTTFAVVINNHIVAAAFAALLLEAMVRIWFDGDHRWRTFILAGLYSGLLTANELPAGIFSAAATLVLLAVSFRRTLAGYLPAAAAVMLVFLATNEISLHSWKLAQMRRNTTNPAENWYDYSYRRSLRDAAGHIVRDPVTGAVKSRPPIDSYWRNPSGIDRGESSTGKYAFHILLGHHGFFSLTPIFLASLAGLFIWLFSSADNRKRVLALWIAVATIVCIVFYIWGGPDHNYGGVASGFRWLFWITPLWIVLLLPMADMSESRPVLRGILLVLLALSALSAAYPTWNPWTNPWIYDWMAFNHWL